MCKIAGKGILKSIIPKESLTPYPLKKSSLVSDECTHFFNMEKKHCEDNSIVFLVFR